MENAVNWSKDQANSNKIADNVVTASLSEGRFCLLSRKNIIGFISKGHKRYLKIVSISCDLWRQKITGYTR